jgi:hypothetical protein
VAIDSRSKRASAMGFGAAWLPPAVPPDGTIGQGDRQHVIWFYSGILATAAAALTTHADRTYAVSSESRVLSVDNESRVYAVSSESRTKAVE